MAYASTSRLNADGPGSRPESVRLSGRTLFRAIPGHRALVWVVVFSIIINVLLLVLPFYSIQVFDRVISSGSIETLIGLTVFALLAIGLSSGFEILRSRLLSRFAVGFEQFITPLVLKASIIAPGKADDPGFNTVQRVRELRNALAGSTLCTLIDAPFLPVFLVVLYLIHPWYGTIGLLGSLLLLALAFASARVARAEQAMTTDAARRAQRTLDSVVRHGHLVRAMGWTQGAIRAFVQLNDDALGPVVRANDRVALIAAAARTIRLALQIAAVGLGAWLVLINEVLAGSMMASSIIISRTLAPIEHLVASLRTVQSAQEAWNRVCEATGRAILDRRRTLLPPPLGHLDVAGVNFRNATGRRLALSGVSFRCPAASIVVIIGPTGAGKSTLLRLIAGLDRPSAGTIRLDGASLDNWDRDQLGRYVGYLPQDVELMGGTVAEAIAGFDDNASDETIVAAARQANAHEMILALPGGYETDIGQEGSKLSGGQRQRIGLARALFGARKLILLDEPNSNLDPDGEEALCAAIRAAKARGTTLVIVTHRPRLLTVADRILFLRDGAAVAFGPPAEVLPQTMAGATPMRGRQAATPDARSPAFRRR